MTDDIRDVLLNIVTEAERPFIDAEEKAAEARAAMILSSIKAKESAWEEQLLSHVADELEDSLKNMAAVFTNSGLGEVLGAVGKNTAYGRPDVVLFNYAGEQYSIVVRKDLSSNGIGFDAYTGAYAGRHSLAENHGSCEPLDKWTKSSAGDVLSAIFKDTVSGLDHAQLMSLKKNLGAQASISKNEKGLAVGAIETTGDHKGEIYGGIFPGDNAPIWFSLAPEVMDHYKAAAWAEAQDGSLPTRAQGDYLTTFKGKGAAFTEIFNRGGHGFVDAVWLAEQPKYDRYDAWCERLNDGLQYRLRRKDELLVLCVRR